MNGHNEQAFLLPSRLYCRLRNPTGSAAVKRFAGLSPGA